MEINLLNIVAALNYNSFYVYLEIYVLFWILAGVVWNWPLQKIP